MTLALLEKVDGYSPQNGMVARERIRTQAQESGYFKTQRFYYTITLLADVFCLLAGVGLLIVSGNLLIQILACPLFLTLMHVRFGFIVHDAGHHQIFQGNMFLNNIVGQGAAFVIGGSFSWWVHDHNRHHDYPNDPVKDPDLHYQLNNFLEKNREHPWWGILARHKVITALLIRSVMTIFLTIKSAWFLLKGEEVISRKLEITLFIAHFTLYFGGLILLLGPWCVVFIAVHYVASGLYFGSIFATNHKGLTVFEDSRKVDFLTRQVETTGNTPSNWLVNYFTGGLAQQIQHHLMSDMPRNNLPKIDSFCREEVEKAGLIFRVDSFWYAQMRGL